MWRQLCASRRARACARGDLGNGVVKATHRFQVSPLPLPSQAQADECADTPELREVCFPPLHGGAAGCFWRFLSQWSEQQSWRVLITWISRQHTHIYEHC